MAKKILAINPRVNYIGYALFHNSELKDWGIKAVNEKWSDDKKQKIGRILQKLLDRHNPGYLAVKKSDSGRSSPKLISEISCIEDTCRKRNIPVLEYSIPYLKEIISGKSGNRKFVKQIYRRYPLLDYEAEKELKMTEAEILAEIQQEENEKEPKQEFKNERDKRLYEMKEQAKERQAGYYMTVFETVALGHVCFNQIDNS